MTLRDTQTGHIYGGAELRTDRAESSYGQPMLIAGGDAYDKGLAHLSLQILAASHNERQALSRAGYRLTDYKEEKTQRCR